MPTYTEQDLKEALIRTLNLMPSAEHQQKAKYIISVFKTILTNRKELTMGITKTKINLSNATEEPEVCKKAKEAYINLMGNAPQESREEGFLVDLLNLVAHIFTCPACKGVGCVNCRGTGLQHPVLITRYLAEKNKLAPAMTPTPSVAKVPSIQTPVPSTEKIKATMAKKKISGFNIKEIKTVTLPDKK